MRDSIKQALLSVLESLGIKGDEVALEHPSDLKNGDYASSVALQYAKELGLAPKVLAEKIVASLGRSPTGETLGKVVGVAKIEIAGPGFINFYLAPEAIAEAIEKARREDMWGTNETRKGKKIMVEYTDPNPFKEFHIGHLMSNAIGESIARLLQFSSAEVERVNYQGDVGPHVAKCIWGIKNLGVDPHNAAALGKAYAAGATAYENDPEAKVEIDEINKKVYDRTDAEINAFYDAGRQASLDHFEKIYQKLSTKFDHYYFESASAPRGVEIVKAHPEVFEESDGAIVYKGEKVGLHTRVFLTSKGLPTYEAKDLGLTQIKAETWNFDTSIIVTASEQSGYFSVVLAAMREIFPDVAAKTVHVSHGMMRFAEGKMSSRTGNVVTGESLLSELTEQAKARATESRADNPKQLAEQVAVAAVKYQVLKQVSDKDIIFYRERALSLEGDSGPYLQYAHARTHQIVEKAKEQDTENHRGDASMIPEGDALRISEQASDLARLLVRFPEIVQYASKLLEPHLVTTYLVALASAFNSWYAKEQILDGTPAAPHKVALTDAVRKTLKNGLWILGIPAPEKM